ncbi:MAG: site-2 protease family protein [Bacteroidia bacterium]
MALSFGDKTAEYEGRLTLNPIKHIDWFGSIILPFLLYITNAGFMIGWAKPVPYNPYNLKHRKIAEPLVALAGPLSNLFVAIVFGIAVRILISNGMGASPLVLLFGFVVLINISLAIFNLIPIPPLDGSKILFSFIPQGRFAFSAAAQKYGLVLIIALFIFLPWIAGIISPVISSLFTLMTGISA